MTDYGIFNFVQLNENDKLIVELAEEPTHEVADDLFFHQVKFKQFLYHFVLCINMVFLFLRKSGRRQKELDKNEKKVKLGSEFYFKSVQRIILL